MTTSSRLFLLASITLVAAACLRASATQAPVPLRQPLSTLPLTLDGWSGHELPPFDAATAAVLKADEYISRNYVRHSSEVADLYIGYYASQAQGDLIHSPMNCLPAAGWQPLTIGRSEVVSGETRVPVNRYVVQKGTDKRLVLYWYQSHGRAVASEYWSRAYLALDALRLHRTDAALVRVITPIYRDEALAERSAMAFIRALLPILGTHLPE
jgi:EpsI family protein